jgi:acetyl esterase/lipase
MIRFRSLIFSFAIVALSQAGFAQQSASEASQVDSSTIDAHGVAHITRVVPVPDTVSLEAQRSLAKPIIDPPMNETLAQKRVRTDAYARSDAEAYRAKYPVAIESSSIAGVPVRIITPTDLIAHGKDDRVLINLHGGGFTTDSGSLTESIPIASLTRTKVVAVLYRLAPEHPFPAAVDDSVAVYRELLKTHKPEDIAIYGASAGAILTAETAAKLKQLGLPLPAALGIFTGSGDFSKTGDSQAMYSVTGLGGRLHPPSEEKGWIPAYVGTTDPKDPILSPIYSDLHGMPPTLFLTSTRDMLLSATTILHRAFLHAGVDAQLIVFEGLNHGFWYDANLPEAIEADEMMANFFDEHLGARKSPSQLHAK